MTRRQRFCARCVVNPPYRQGKLCEDCLEANWRWCSLGKHAVPLDLDYSWHHYACLACRRIDDRKRYRRGLPDGYITVPMLAKRLGYHHTWLRMQITNYGWLAGDVVQFAPRGKWYVRELAEYPALIRRDE